jgi:hypothetical protein
VGSVRPARGAVAVVGGHVITPGLLGRWMREEVGEDFFLAAGGQRAPADLVAGPGRVSGCVGVLRGLAPSGIQSASQLRVRCLRLNRAIERQALEYLVRSYWALDFAAAHGITVTEDEERQELARYAAINYPGHGGLQRVLKSRARTLSQELFIFGNDLVSRKLLAVLSSRGASSLAREATREADTARCPAEYVVEHCAGYSSVRNSPQGPSARVLLEEIAAWLPTSHGRP